jgi:hypothetical protein
LYISRDLLTDGGFCYSGINGTSLWSWVPDIHKRNVIIYGTQISLIVLWCLWGKGHILLAGIKAYMKDF